MLTQHGVELRRVLKAPAQLVFEAWTKPELMARWFFPGADWQVQVSADLRIGGRYELRMREADGKEHLQFGVYREIAPALRLVFTWSCPDLGVIDSLVTVQLTPRGTGTELHVMHELPANLQVRQGHDEGWQGCLANLAVKLGWQTE
jgi:uncharacterized protein YndB with AHSA1/START domain